VCVFVRLCVCLCAQTMVKVARLRAQESHSTLTIFPLSQLVLLLLLIPPHAIDEVRREKMSLGASLLKKMAMK